MSPRLTAIAAAIVASLTAAGILLGASPSPGTSYEVLLPRILAPASDPTLAYDPDEVATTYGLVASAAAAAGDDATADMAADWLIADMGAGGWGTKWTWDPFSDGSPTPGGTPFSGMTALAINGLLDHGVDDTTARKMADVVMTWARDGWSHGFYWYSLAPQDAVYAPDGSAMMAGATARFLAEHGELFDPSERAFLADRVQRSIDRLRTGDSGYLRWHYSDRQDIVNDLSHHASIIWGVEETRDAGFDIPWSRADALRTFDEYDVIYPIDIDPTQEMSARYGSAWEVSGTGAALAVIARWGGDVRPWAQKARVALERAPFSSRFAANTLLGFALAGLCDCPARRQGP